MATKPNNVGSIETLKILGAVSTFQDTSSAFVKVMFEYFSILPPVSVTRREDRPVYVRDYSQWARSCRDRPRALPAYLKGDRTPSVGQRLTRVFVQRSACSQSEIPCANRLPFGDFHRQLRHSRAFRFATGAQPTEPFALKAWHRLAAELAILGRGERRDRRRRQSARYGSTLSLKRRALP